MAEKVRWGILGVAKINDRLLPAFAKAKRTELRAIASRSLDRAQAAAKLAGIPHAYGSYDALLDDPNIDAIYNPLPNTLHAEWTKKAVDCGKHVLCEKPLCPTADEARSVVEYCRTRNVCLMDGFMWPHHPRTRSLREFLDRGEIGAVRRVSGAFTFKMTELSNKNIRLQTDLGGGSLLDVGCYPVYGIRWAFQQEPVRVWATARYEHGCDVEMNGTLWFPDGGMATFDCGFVHPVRQWLEITGERGMVHVQDMWLPPHRAVFEIHGDGISAGAPLVHAVEGHDQIQLMLEHFAAFVLDRKPVIPPADEAVKTLRVLDALARSAREGRIVDVVSHRN